MGSFLESIPRAVLVFLVLIGALFFIYQSNPPYTVCNSQQEVFQVSQTPFLYLDPKNPGQTTLGFQKALTRCKETNSVGGCLEFFEGLKRMAGDLESINSECTEDVALWSPVQPVLNASLETTVRLAWGSQGPEGIHDKLGWMDTSHVGLYCRLKKLAINYYGNEAFASFRERMLTTLPKATEMGRAEAWKRILLSVPCPGQQP